MLDSWLRDGIITPAESPLGTSLVPVAKKDGKTRWAVDFRALNAVTIADSVPVSSIGEVLMDLAGSKYLSSLDKAQAFHKIPGANGIGTYQFIRIPFGLKNAGAMYCRLVKMLLDKLQLSGKVLANLDNILVHTRTENEHLHALNKVLEAHVDAVVCLKAKKTKVFKESMEFLGHKVSAKGIGLSNRHVDTISRIQRTDFLFGLLMDNLGYIYTM